jgi:hypothetical protein
MSRHKLKIFGGAPAIYSILCKSGALMACRTLYLRWVEKIDRFQDGSNSSRGHFPAFKMAIPIIAVFGYRSGKGVDRRQALARPARFELPRAQLLCPYLGEETSKMQQNLGIVRNRKLLYHCALTTPLNTGDISRSKNHNLTDSPNWARSN